MQRSQSSKIPFKAKKNLWMFMSEKKELKTSTIRDKSKNYKLKKEM